MSQISLGGFLCTYVSFGVLCADFPLMVYHMLALPQWWKLWYQHPDNGLAWNTPLVMLTDFVFEEMEEQKEEEHFGYFK